MHAEVVVQSELYDVVGRRRGRVGARGRSCNGAHGGRGRRKLRFYSVTSQFGRHVGSDEVGPLLGRSVPTAERAVGRCALVPKDLATRPLCDVARGPRLNFGV